MSIFETFSHVFSWSVHKHGCDSIDPLQRLVGKSLMSWGRQGGGEDAMGTFYRAIDQSLMEKDFNPT
ncbi:MAG: hypothetical protein C5B49_13255 [Bdellovibrio sp.]|nr:MAG: hypothetical protein C5B49_13255 [Bdellovibrio sp.]